MTFDEALAKLKNASPLRITVSGDIGSGKSTFTKRLAAELDIPRTYVGQMMRDEAAARGLSLDDFNKLLNEDDEVDRRLDELQREKSVDIERGVFEGRTSWHFVVDPKITVFLSVDPDAAANRIWKDDNANRDAYESVDDLIKANVERKASEEKRYQAYYNISAYNLENFDVTIDTTPLTLDEVFEQTVIAIATHLHSES
ncbi:AAA family ATPase [Candidatus Uhrbacteria bacterium]|jgi:CMP/dCMP kinase|nr:AAA family ATPase [Candidatus Uhrbacteria bacterium]